MADNETITVEERAKSYALRVQELSANAYSSPDSCETSMNIHMDKALIAETAIERK